MVVDIESRQCRVTPRALKEWTKAHIHKPGFLPTGPSSTTRGVTGSATVSVGGRAHSTISRNARKSRHEICSAIEYRAKVSSDMPAPFRGGVSLCRTR